jgi:broad specificity phosphatase PhoE
VTDKIIRDYSEQNVLAVTHHIWLLALRANLEHLDVAGYIDLDKNHKPINCGVTIYRGDPDQGRNGKLILDTYNERLY